MSNRVSDVPLGVEIARAQNELVRDRGAMRAARATLAEGRILAAQEMRAAAFVLESVEVFSGPAAEVIEGAERRFVDRVREALRDEAGRARALAGRIGGSEGGEDFAAQSSERRADELSKLRRPSG